MSMSAFLIRKQLLKSWNKFEKLYLAKVLILNYKINWCVNELVQVHFEWRKGPFASAGTSEWNLNLLTKDFHLWTEKLVRDRYFWNKKYRPLTPAEQCFLLVGTHHFCILLIVLKYWPKLKIFLNVYAGWGLTF